MATSTPASNDSETTLDTSGASATSQLYSAAIGPVNTDRYLQAFTRLEAQTSGMPTWNWAAAMLSFNWMLFRQLWGAALVYVGALVGASLLMFGVGQLVFDFSDAVQWGLLGALALVSILVPGLLGDRLLYQASRRKVQAALAANATLPEACAMLKGQAVGKKRIMGLGLINAALLGVLAAGYLALPDMTSLPMHSERMQQARNVATGRMSDAGVTPQASASAPATSTAPVLATSAATAPASVGTGISGASGASGAIGAMTTSTASVAAPAASANPAASALSVASTASTAGSASASAAPPRTTASAPALPSASRAAAVATPPASAPQTAAAKLPASAPVNSSASASASSTRPLPGPATTGAISSRATPTTTPAATPPPAISANSASKAAPKTLVPATPKPAITTEAKRDAPAARSAEAKRPEQASPQYLINVGLFADSNNALNVFTRLKDADLPVLRDPARTAKGPVTRIRVGPFETEVEAQRAAERIQALKLDAVVVRR